MSDSITARPAHTDMHTLEDLAAWAAANHVQSVMPSDWLPLLKQAEQIGYDKGCREGCADTRVTVQEVLNQQEAK